MDVKTLIERALTVSALKEILDNFNDDDVVLITSDYGDHCHTEQVHLVTEEDFAEIDNDQMLTDGSGYSASGIKVRTRDEVLELTREEKGPRNVVLIRLTG